MRSKSQGQIAGLVGMASAILWIIGLIIEYRFGLQPPGNGSSLYYLDQTLFFIALFGYLVALIGLFQSRAAGEGAFGKISLGIFIAALVALLVANVVQVLTRNPNFFLYPIGGLLQLLGGLLTGIAVVVARRWDGWQRFAPLIQSIYYLILLVIMVAFNKPSFLGEALWQLTWFLTSLALYTKTRRVAVREPLSKTYS